MTPPPTSIDGTDITGATIDGQEVTAITVDGTEVFSASQVPDSIIDNFEKVVYEDENETLSDYYGGDISGFERNTNSPVEQGSFSLKTISSNSSIASKSLPNLPQSGDEFRCYFFVAARGGRFLKIGFAAQSEVAGPDGYYVQYEGTNGSMFLVKRENGSDTVIASDNSASTQSPQFWEMKVVWGSTISVTCTQLSDPSNEFNFSASDTTYTSGGIAFEATEIEHAFDGYEFTDR